MLPSEMAGSRETSLRRRACALETAAERSLSRSPDAWGGSCSYWRAASRREQPAQGRGVEIVSQEAEGNLQSR